MVDRDVRSDAGFGRSGVNRGGIGRSGVGGDGGSVNRSWSFVWSSGGSRGRSSVNRS